MIRASPTMRMTWKATAPVRQFVQLANAYASFRSWTGPPSLTQSRSSAVWKSVEPSWVFTATIWLSPAAGSRGRGNGKTHDDAAPAGAGAAAGGCTATAAGPGAVGVVL